MSITIRTLVPLIALLLPAFVQAENQPKLGKYPTVLFSSEGHTVTIVRLGNDDNTALIKVDGIDNDLDGKILKHTKICENTDCTTFKYETKEIPGKERWWTLRSSRQWGSYDEVSLYPPGVEKKFPVSTGKRPDQFDSEKFYQQYLGQKASTK